MDRRDFLKAFLLTESVSLPETQSFASDQNEIKLNSQTNVDWNSGLLEHLLPTVNSDRFLI